MEKAIELKQEYNTLANLHEYLTKETSFECAIDYDIWDVRTGSNGQMEKCIIIKKSNMHGVKIYFEKENVVKTTYIIPNKILNAYFGKSQKARQNIIEIIAGIIKNAVLVNSQKAAFNELNAPLNKIEA